MGGGGDQLDLARYRKANAVRAVNDALTELLVADRRLQELLGSQARADQDARRVADGPAGFSPVSPAGPEGGAWPPEWAR
jgi:hypothetical protein